jgi:hypothetical protein
MFIKINQLLSGVAFFGRVRHAFNFPMEVKERPQLSRVHHQVVLNFSKNLMKIALLRPLANIDATIAASVTKISGRTEKIFTDKHQQILDQKTAATKAQTDLANAKSATEAETFAFAAESAQLKASNFLSELDALFGSLADHQSKIAAALATITDSLENADKVGKADKTSFIDQITALKVQVEKLQTDIETTDESSAPAMVDEAEKAAVEAQRLLGELQTAAGEFALAAFQGRIAAAKSKASGFVKEAESLRLLGSEAATKLLDIQTELKTIETAQEEINSTTTKEQAEPIALKAEQSAAQTETLLTELRDIISRQTSGYGSQKSGSAEPKIDVSKISTKASPSVKWSEQEMTMTNDVNPVEPKNDHMSIVLPKDQRLTHVITGFYQITASNKYKPNLTFALPSLPKSFLKDSSKKVAGLLNVSGIANLNDPIPLLVIGNFVYRVFEVCINDTCSADDLENPLFDDGQNNIPLLTKIKDFDGFVEKVKSASEPVVKLMYFKLEPEDLSQLPEFADLTKNIKLAINYPTHPGNNQHLKSFADDTYKKFLKLKGDGTITEYLNLIPLGNCQVSALAALEHIKKNKKFEGIEYMAAGYMPKKRFYADDNRTQLRYSIDLNAVNHAFNLVYEKSSANPLASMFAIDVTGDVSAYLEAFFTNDLKTYLEGKLNSLANFKLVTDVKREEQFNGITSITPSGDIIRQLTAGEVEKINDAQSYLRRKEHFIDALRKVKGYENVVEVTDNDVKRFCEANGPGYLCLMSPSTKNIYNVVVNRYDYSLSQANGLAFFIDERGGYDQWKYTPTIYDPNYEQEKFEQQSLYNPFAPQLLSMLQTLGADAEKAQDKDQYLFQKSSFLKFPPYFGNGHWYGINFQAYENIASEVKFEVTQIVKELVQEESHQVDKTFAKEMLKHTIAPDAEVTNLVTDGSIVLRKNLDSDWKYGIDFGSPWGRTNEGNQSKVNSILTKIAIKSTSLGEISKSAAKYTRSYFKINIDVKASAK